MSDQGRRDNGKPTFIEGVRRRQIVEVTIATIAELGYPAASLATIARRAGISKGVISYHFTDKDDLITTVLVEIYTAVGTAMVERIGTPPSAAEALARYIRANLDYFGHHRAAGRALQEILTHFHPKAALLPEHEMRDEESVAAIEPIFVWGQKTGEFDAFPPRIAAIMVRRSIDGVLEYWFHHQDQNLEAHADALAALIVRAAMRTPL